MKTVKFEWRDRVREQVKHRPRDCTYQELADYLGVTTRWLSAFANGNIRNPGISTVQALSEYLDNRFLFKN